MSELTPFSLAPVYTPNAVRSTHELSQGLIAFWHVCQPLSGGNKWYDLVQGLPLSFSQVSSGGGWSSESYSTSPYNNGSITLTGVADYLSLANYSPLLGKSAGSLAMWIKWNGVENVSGSEGVFGWQENAFASAMFGLGYSTQRTAFCLGTTSSTYTLQNAFGTLGQKWTFVCGTWANNTATLYQNGVSVASTTTAGTLTSNQASTLILGKDTQSSPGYYNGGMADFMVWNRGLSAQEVEKLYLESRQAFPNMLRRLWTPLRSNSSGNSWLGTANLTDVVTINPIAGVNRSGKSADTDIVSMTATAGIKRGGKSTSSNTVTVMATGSKKVGAVATLSNDIVTLNCHAGVKYGSSTQMQCQVILNANGSVAGTLFKALDGSVSFIPAIDASTGVSNLNASIGVSNLTANIGVAG